MRMSIIVYRLIGLHVSIDARSNFLCPYPQCVVIPKPHVLVRLEALFSCNYL